MILSIINRFRRSAIGLQVQSGKMCVSLVQFLGAALALVLLAACSSGSPGQGAAITLGHLSVVTTNYSLEYFARQIGGDAALVANLVPPGVEAHDFEPAPADIRTLREADLVLYNGGGFEPWIERALASGDKASQVTVEVSQSLRGPQNDPHVWLNPLLAVEEVKLVRDGLAKAHPRKADVFNANAEALMSELQSLHQRYQQGLASCRFKAFVTSHDAFGHLAARYSLEVVPLAGISPEAEPSPGDLAAIADRLRSLGVKYLLVEPISSQRLSQTVAKEIGADLLPLHPLESLTPEELQQGETYFTIMNANLASLRTALECS